MLAVLLNATLVTLVALFGVRAVAIIAFRTCVMLRTCKTRAVDHEQETSKTLRLNILECENWYLGSWGLLTRDQCV